MTSTLLVLLALASAPPADDPAALVARLGADSFDERVAAYKALEKLGGDALPALQAARDATDPRVRTRVRSLLASVKAADTAGRLTRPTLVRLDFRDRPLGEVVEALNARHDLRLAVRLGPLPTRGMFFDPERADLRARRLERKVTVEAPAPLPFWEALDRLCRADGLR
jgi:hypothetical protein